MSDRGTMSQEGAMRIRWPVPCDASPVRVQIPTTRTIRKAQRSQCRRFIAWMSERVGETHRSALWRKETEWK